MPNRPQPATWIRPVRTAALLLGWLLASGCLWDVVQVVAWSRMLVLNLEDRPVVEAVAYTFSEDAMCGLCKTVQAAREQPEEDVFLVTAVGGKPPLLPVGLVRQRIIPPPGHRTRLAVACFRTPVTGPFEPPVPPPRAG